MKDEILDDGLLPKGTESKDFVEIRTYAFDHEAQIAKAFLEAQGIASFLKNGNMLSVYSGLSAGFGGVGLMVLGENAERALEVLDGEEEDIEIDDEMLTEAYLRDIELQAEEREQEIPDSTTSFDVIFNAIFIAFGAAVVLYLLFYVIL